MFLCLFVLIICCWINLGIRDFIPSNFFAAAHNLEVVSKVHFYSTFNSETVLVQVAYTAVMQSVKSSDKTGYESLLKIYRETDVSQERTRVLSN